ncbi:MAG: aminoglycoside phosphotransferase family protein [Nitrospirales bacterium]
MSAVNPSLSRPPQAPPDPALVADTLRRKLPFSAEFVSLTPLVGDASNRRYYRVHLRVHLAGTTPPSLVLMQLAEPEPFKQSEEAVSGGHVPISELPFLNVLSHLARAGIPVPALHYHDQEKGLLYLEDCGDVTLLQACQSVSETVRQGLYEEALDLLAHLHLRATATLGPHCVAAHRRFDVPLLMWEFDHFLEYGVVARNGQPMWQADHDAVRGEFVKIAEMMAAQSQIFTHRDYHSRNLMVREPSAPDGGRPGWRLAVLDFQDALLGPAAYDLASLLRDAYIAVDEGWLDHLIGRYVSRMTEGGLALGDRSAFRRVFDLTSLQRNLKAAGRFVFIDRIKGNPTFLADVPRTLGYVRRNLQKYPELAPLRKHLSPYVPELQD